ncbi:MAG TPA: NAD(P)/FAD-dependent oxidoreductase, partial [Phycisphaerae bacterium]
MPDVVVVGSGPNGLAAAIVIAQAGRHVLVVEAADTIGGGCRTAECTLPGFKHDICSAIHPFAIASPLFRTLPLAKYGLEWVHPPAMFAHPMDDGSAAIVYRSIPTTAEGLGADGPPYHALFARLSDMWPSIEDDVLGPLRWPRHPIKMARFGSSALHAAESVSRRTFSSEAARGLFAGVAAHAMLPLDTRPTGAVGLVLTLMAHVAGWPFPRGGAQRLTDTLASYLRSIGGEIRTGVQVTSLGDLPPAKAILCDLSPKPLLKIAGERLPAWYRKALERYRYGMGVYKVDWALDGPVPWRNADCSRAATVHLGGSLSDIASSERDAWNGRHAERPFVLLAQPTLFDASRAPAGRHTLWTYCHVPHGSDVDMLPRIEQQIERFAPGFRDRVLARAVMRPADIERHNANLVGGDIGAGVTDVRQLVARPTWRTYSTPVRGLYICSASTPPGVGVHGM